MWVKIASVTAALALSAPAFAITINITNFTYGPAPELTVTGLLPMSVDAGEFSGVVVSDFTPAVTTQSLTTQSLAMPQTVASGPSFNAYCAELSQLIPFNTTYSYSQSTGLAYLGAGKLEDMSRLFSAAAGFVTDADTSAAMQAAVWEIIYQNGSDYDLGSGSFEVSATLGTDTSLTSALNKVNGFLLNLDSYAPTYQISVLTNPNQQDLLIATIPEPQTWALMAGGLLAIGALARRRKPRRDTA